MGEVQNSLLPGMPQAKAEYRGRIELLRSRMNLLKGKDKLLMTMYLENSNSFRQMSRLAGIDETSISRKISRIIKRLTEGRYIICLRNRNKFTAKELAIAKEYFMLGLSVKQIAARRRWTYYRAYKTVKEIQQRIKNDMQED
jgi:transposase-like protein